jgi:16S rRNA (guanine(966)-N(2))-methyltransferase RsmD
VSRAPSGEIRLIGGQWKRSKLSVPDRPGLRPTPDRVRETLFNWLGQDLTGWHCLDAFAGTGALGLEAASRGAARVSLIELDASLVKLLQGHCQRLSASNVVVHKGDGLAALKKAEPASLDLIFLDPPFDANLFAPALASARPALREDGWLYLEAPTAWAADALAELGYALHKHLKAGAVHAHLLRMGAAQA